jgi:hypothetical protein
MLVVLTNAVKVESVPLNFRFSCADVSVWAQDRGIGDPPWAPVTAPTQSDVAAGHW